MKTMAAREFGGSLTSIPASRFPPYWRDSMDDLLVSYHRICSYLCLYISRGTGARSVDHMIPKSMAWDRAYEWRNYRLACSLMNARKGEAASVLDPFDVKNGWFVLELVAFQVLPGQGFERTDRLPSVADTIKRLRLNDEECCNARAEYAEEYWGKHVTISYVRRHAPFVESELRRQNRLLEADS